MSVPSVAGQLLPMIDAQRITYSSWQLDIMWIPVMGSSQRLYPTGSEHGQRVDAEQLSNALGAGARDRIVDVLGDLDHRRACLRSLVLIFLRERYRLPRFQH